MCTSQRFQLKRDCFKDRHPRVFFHGTDYHFFLPKGDSQVKSKDLMQVSTQRELELFRQPEPNTMPIEAIRKQQGPGAAFTLACASSGLADQTIYEFVDIDAGTFSKIKKGLATLQADQWVKFCYAVNNYIYPEWCAFQLGRTLVEIKTEAERRADAAEKRALEAELKVSVLMETYRARAVA